MLGKKQRVEVDVEGANARLKEAYDQMDHEYAMRRGLLNVHGHSVTGPQPGQVHQAARAVHEEGRA